VQCLLLEDLDEVARYQGAANGAPAEIRIFKSNLAVLPLAGTPSTSPTPRSTSNLASSATPRRRANSPICAPCAPPTWDVRFIPLRKPGPPKYYRLPPNRKL
jgi:hypothetical protein